MLDHTRHTISETQAIPAKTNHMRAIIYHEST